MYPIILKPFLGRPKEKSMIKNLSLLDLSPGLVLRSWTSLRKFIYFRLKMKSKGKKFSGY